MGGLAVRIDWDRPIEAEEAARMLSATPFRSTAGLRSVSTSNASLAEGRTHEEDPMWEIASLGGTQIVADVRVWHRDRLRSVAGGASATQDFDDRTLILAAYLRSGWAKMLEALDGDFAFVIWDANRQLAIAARDRFGVMPLFFTETASGIAFATEPKHLVRVTQRAEPDLAALGAYLGGRPTPGRSTYLDGISRVMPAEAIITSARAVTHNRYWHPSPREDSGLEEADVPQMYREHLVDAVQRRLKTATTTLSQLSGGLDSTSIAAAAQTITERHGDPSRFATVSAIFPDSTADESAEIVEVVANQPFDHYDFVLDPPDIDAYPDIMRRTDRPQVSPVHGLETGTGRYGQTVGADLLLTGTAGDDLIDDTQLLVDLLEQRSWRRWRRGSRAIAGVEQQRVMSIAVPSLVRATPARTKEIIRRVLPQREPEQITLMTDDLRAHLVTPDPDSIADAYPSRTQRSVISDSCSRRTAQLNEYIEARIAPYGLGVSHPHLDLTLIEFVASVPVQTRPIDGRSKAMVRQAFDDLLPRVVITKRHKTKADDLFLEAFTKMVPAIRDRYPAVPDAAQHVVDSDLYASALNHASTTGPGMELFRTLWPAWTTFMWMDTLVVDQR